MYSNSLPTRSWGLNHGEESFLDTPVGMITLARCSASCLYCYLSTSNIEETALSVFEFLEIARSLAIRGATCLYLVNPEVPNLDLIIEALAQLRHYEPKFPIVLKLGGHEPLQLAQALQPFIDAVSLDIKVFNNNDAANWLGRPDYINNVQSLLNFWMTTIGPFFLREGKRDIRGLWLRHVVLPHRAKIWAAAMSEIDPTNRLPIWVTLQYRPFGRARSHPILGRPLDKNEHKLAIESVQFLRSTGRTVWLS